MSFSLDLSKFAKKAEANAAAVVRNTALRLFSRIVYDTPVDTGRAAGNWQPSIGSPVTGTIDRLGAAKSEAEIKNVIGGWKQGDIWLSNNLPYIRRLEYGYSQKQPAGMVRVNLRNFQQYVDAAVRTVK